MHTPISLFSGIRSGAAFTGHVRTGDGQQHAADRRLEHRSRHRRRTTPLPGFNTVLQGMGNETIAGDAQPIDIMALEETTSNAVTVQPILDDLNGDYSNANYQMSNVQGTVFENIIDSGDGPNAIVYNAKTVTLLDSVGE